MFVVDDYGVLSEVPDESAAETASKVLAAEPVASTPWYRTPEFVGGVMTALVVGLVSLAISRAEARMSAKAS